MAKALSKEKRKSKEREMDYLRACFGIVKIKIPGVAGDYFTDKEDIASGKHQAYWSRDRKRK